MVNQVYRPRKPQLSPLWKCLYTHFYDFIREYTEKHEKKYGFLKPAVEEVVNKYLDCGNLTKGFARLHCDKCNKDYLLAFSCKGRWFCPSCHQKKVLLFSRNGMFYVAPKISTKPLEQMFRVRVIKMLAEEDLLADELAGKLLGWKHSGFSVHNGKPIKRNDTDGLKRVAQYIIRNPFSEQKMTYNEESGTVIYRSRIHAKTKRNFEIFSAQDFIAAITQHIPEKGFQMVRYYGWYSNRARGERAKSQALRSQVSSLSPLTVIDVSDYQPRRLPSKKWRELIKQVWEVDPFDCPRCGSEMKLIALIDDNEVIEKILRHLDLWPENSLPARAPPQSMIQDCIYEPFFDDYPDYDEAAAG